MTALYARHEGRLRRAIEANRTRTYWTPFQESPSQSLHPHGAQEAGRVAFERLLKRPFEIGQPHNGWVHPPEVSPFTLEPLEITYEALDIETALAQAHAARRLFRQAGPHARLGMCMEMLQRLADASFLNTFATMHTAGQAFMMAFAGSGANSLDRGLEALAMAAVAMEQVPAEATFERRFGRSHVTLNKRYHVVGRGTAVVFSCATYPAWNAYPALFANLAVGNPVVVKPHPTSVLPMALAVRICRTVLTEVGLSPALVQLAVDTPEDLVGLRLVNDPRVPIVDFTGGQAFGRVLEQRGRQVYTETAGCNSVIVESTDDLDATLAAIAHSLCIFSAQMCTAAQNIYVPASGVNTPEGVVAYDEVCRRLVAAVDRWVSDPAKAAAICGAIQSDHTVAALDQLLAAQPDACLRAHTRYTHPEFPTARTLTPLLLALDPSTSDLHRREHFGPVGFVLKATDREDALTHATRDAAACGAIASYAFSTEPGFCERVEEAFVEAGASVAFNLHRQLPINYTAAYSDFHVTGLNPAGTACLSDLAFVADRFRIVQSKTEES